MIFRRMFAVFALMAASCLAADVDGKWVGAMSTPNGDIPVTFQFKTEGAALTGSTSGPDGASIAIANGKADGNNISFTVTIDFGGMPFTLSYKGVVADGQIKFAMDIMGMPLELTVKKAS
jgi:hypothetical protein